MNDTNNLTPHTNSKQKIIAAFIIILVVVIIAEGVSFFNHKQNNQMASTTNAAAANAKATTTSTSSAPDTTYKDGTYAASGSYLSPGGQETINVSITLKNSKVTATSVNQVPVTPESQEYQTDFKQHYQALVVGKKIASIKLSRVSGSSLTSQGFNNALKQIESQAS